MSGWRRWGAYVVLTMVFAIACVGLGVWQFERRAETVERIQLIQRNYGAAPVPLAQEVPDRSSFDASVDWHPVTVTGTYAQELTVLVRNRSSEQGPGFEILVPLRTESGDLFVVNRGWIERDDRGNPPTDIPDAPEGTVTVEARLRPTERTPVGQRAVDNLVPAIDLEVLASRWNEPTYTRAYGIMVSEDPAATAGVPLSKPSTSEGNHLSYAFQWLAFAVLGVVALLWGIRRERIIARGDSAVRSQKRVSNPSDADIEDAIVDDSHLSRR